jgi:endonuclease VIII
MSEGDIVHHAARRIDAALAGRVPEQILTPQPRHALDRWPERLAGRAVCGAEARGKHLLVRFAGGLTVHSHLRMTGSWGVYGCGRRWQRSPRRAWLVVRAGEWEVVQFDGPVLDLVGDSRLRSDRRIAGLGPDVIGERFDAALFLARLRATAPARPIGDALLDQRIVAGIGNVWKAESCFAVGLDPWRPVGELSDEEALAVVEFAHRHMTRAAGAGRIARPREVYKRAGQRCVRCGTTIRAGGQGENNRITFWCPGCQR